MHLTPDSNAVRKLRAAMGRVETMCGSVKLAWRMYNERFEMNATVPHNCGKARLLLYVPELFFSQKDATQLCVGNVPVGLRGEGSNVQWGDTERKTVDVFVGGGRSQLALWRCG